MIKRFLRFLASPRLLKVLLFFWVFVILGVVATCLTIKHQGNRAWKEYLAAHPETPLDLSRFIPPDVPREQNFAAIPAFEYPWPISLKASDFNLGALPSIRGGRRFDLPNVLQGKRKENRSTMDQAKEILRELELFEPILQQVRDAAPRPACRFPLDRNNIARDVAERPIHGYYQYWGTSLYAKLPQLLLVNNVSRLFQIKALCLLTVGRHKEAIGELRYILRLYDALRPEPTLLVAETRMSLIEKVVSVAWEGLAASQWNGPELDELESLIGKVDILADARHAHASEAGVINLVMESIYHDPWLLTRNYGIIENVSRFFPRGWIRRGQVQSNKLAQEYVSLFMAPHYTKSRPIQEAMLREWNDSVVKSYRDIPLREVSGELMSHEALYWFALNQCRQLHIACELERYRVSKGFYPGRLSDLGTGLPLDPINSQAFAYTRTKIGYKLWSVGIDQSDIVAVRGIMGMNHWAWELPGELPSQ